MRNLRCTITIDSVLANSKTQDAFLFTVNAIFLHDYPLAVEPGSTPRPLVQKSWRDSLRIDMLLSAVSVFVAAQSSSEIPEGLMNNPVYVPTPPQQRTVAYSVRPVPYVVITFRVWSWWWMRVSSETCRAVLQKYNKTVYSRILLDNYWQRSV